LASECSACFDLHRGVAVSFGAAESAQTVCRPEPEHNGVDFARAARHDHFSAGRFWAPDEPLAGRAALVLRLHPDCLFAGYLAWRKYQARQQRRPTDSKDTEMTAPAAKDTDMAAAGEMAAPEAAAQVKGAEMEAPAVAAQV
jgi:hypothetical protein